MSEYFVSGIGETLGDPLAVNPPFMTKGAVWFVCSVNGTDAGGTAGKDKQKPLKTLAQAQTNASAGDTVFLLNGHAETYTTSLSISKQLYIVGTGLVSGKYPGASFTINAASADAFVLSAAGTQLRNIYFPQSSQSNSFSAGGKVVVETTDCLIAGCYFEMGALDQGAGLIDAVAAPTRLRVENCTFISTATSTATRPIYGMSVQQTVSDVAVIGSVFNDGTVGFSTAALDMSGPTVTRIRAENISLLQGADFLIASASTYLIGGVVEMGGGGIRIV